MLLVFSTTALHFLILLLASAQSTRPDHSRRTGGFNKHETLITCFKSTSLLTTMSLLLLKIIRYITFEEKCLNMSVSVVIKHTVQIQLPRASKCNFHKRSLDIPGFVLLRRERTHPASYRAIRKGNSSNNGNELDLPSRRQYIYHFIV